MARTFRRRNETQEYRWVLREYDYVICEDENFTWKEWRRWQIDPKSEQGEKILAKFHADWHRSWREPGPAWFRRMMTEKPNRRKAKVELNKYLLNEDYEVIIEPKPPLLYWT